MPAARAVAKRGRRRSRKATGCLRSLSFIQWGRYGTAETTTSRSCWQVVTEPALPWRGSMACGRLAFPAISCGIYRFPVERAVEIAVRETLRGVERRNPSRRSHSRASTTGVSAYQSRHSSGRIGRLSSYQPRKEEKQAHAWLSGWSWAKRCAIAPVAASYLNCTLISTSESSWMSRLEALQRSRPVGIQVNGQDRRLQGCFPMGMSFSSMAPALPSPALGSERGVRSNAAASHHRIRPKAGLGAETWTNCDHHGRGWGPTGRPSVRHYRCGTTASSSRFFPTWI